MTRLSTKLWGSTAAALGVALATLAADSASAQCASCATPAVVPTVAFSPVVSQPVAVVQPATVVQPLAVSTSWYPGRQLDLWRMNRLARHTVAMPVVAATPVATTAFMPVTSSCSSCVQPTATTVVAGFAPAVSSCNSCAQTSFMPVVSSAPMTVFRPAVLTPVVMETGCSACSACTTAAPCSSCAGSTTVVEQTSYVEPSSTGCSSCAGATSMPAVTTVIEPSAAPSQGSIVTTPGAAVPDVASPNDPPAPALGTDELTPEAAGSTYDANRPEAAKESAAEQGATPGPVADDPEADPAAYDAPQLLNPNSDLRANRPTVDVHHAVYRQGTPGKAVSTGVRPVSTAKTQAEMDAAAWHSAPASR